MMGFKKFAFCSTCAIVLLGVTPKLEAGLKNEMIASSMKSVTPLIKAGTVILKVFAGGSLLFHSIKAVEDMDSKHKVSSIVYTIVGCIGGVPLVAWAIHDIYADVFKKPTKKKGK